MSLQVWLPLTGDLHNQGLSNLSFTNTNATVNNNGKIGQCYSFDGTAYLRANNFTLSTTTWSLATWIYPTKASTSAHQWILNVNESSAANFLGGLCYYQNKFGIRLKDTTYLSDSTSVTDKWYHVAITYDGNLATDTLKIYINGLKVKAFNKNAIETPYNATKISIGARVGEAGFFEGKLNDVRIYDHALSSKEVEEISKGLILHYKLDDRTNQTGTNLLTAALAATTSGWSKWVNSGATSPTMSYVTVDGYKCVLTTYPTQSSGWSGCGPYKDVSAIEANKVYTFSAFVKAANTASVGKKVVIQTWNNNNVYVSEKCKSRSIILTDSWQRAESQICINTSQAVMIGFGYNYGTNSGEGISFYATQLQWEKSDKAYPIWIPGETSYINTTVYDSSGYSRNGTITGTLAVTGDSPKYSASTDFSNGSISGTNFNYCDGGSMTISFWAYSSNWDATQSTARSVFNGPYSSNTGIRIYRSASTSRLRLQYGTRNVSDGTLSYNASNYLHANGGLSANTWHHFVVVLDSSSGYTNGKIYLDGNRYTKWSSTTVLFNYTNTDPFLIQAPEPGEGRIVDFRIYATALKDGRNDQDEEDPTIPNQIKELYTTSMSIDSSGNIYARVLSEL